MLMLVTGVFWGPWLALTRSLSVFNAEEFIKITKTLSANLGKPMQLMLPLTILTMTLALAFYQHKRSAGFYAGIAAIFLLLASMLITVVVEVPIVKRAKSWSKATLPTDWAAQRDRWIRFHIYIYIYIYIECLAR